ncbi:MAG TPA: transcription antitermination factor NusB [Hyphomicrobiaceae bacterium]|nr:transcription antitermination factor NusB [Hyphomicrobiaceae bacterium]
MAVRLIETVLRDGKPLARSSTARPSAGSGEALSSRDRAFARLIALTVLRRRGSLQKLLDRFLQRPLPEAAARATAILLAGAAQILFIKTPAHAAINLAVEQCRRDRQAHRFAGLTNAVLRRVSSEGPPLLPGLDAASLDVPGWLMDRWRNRYGQETARAIALASLEEPPLDLSVKSDAAGWAERLGGALLPTGSVRLTDAGRIEDLPGYAGGAWWVQDAAAALPIRLLGAVTGKDVADLCAAPGGKSAALAAAGARVTAVDVSPERLKLVRENLDRLDLAASTEIIAADIETWEPHRTFDRVLLDAPCSATGTIRRHPDILHLKQKDELTRLVGLQGRLLARAARLTKPGGLLIYCTCSLEPEECEDQVREFLAAHPEFSRVPILPGESAIEPAWVTRDGDLRTLPCHAPGSAAGGMDGFFAARLRRRE